MYKDSRQFGKGQFFFFLFLLSVSVHFSPISFFVGSEGMEEKGGGGWSVMDAETPDKRLALMLKLELSTNMSMLVLLFN